MIVSGAIASVIGIGQGTQHLGGTPSAQGLIPPRAITDWEICVYDWIFGVVCQNPSYIQEVSPTQYLYAIALIDSTVFN